MKDLGCSQHLALQGKLEEYRFTWSTLIFFFRSTHTIHIPVMEKADRLTGRTIQAVIGLAVELLHPEHEGKGSWRVVEGWDWGEGGQAGRLEAGETRKQGRGVAWEKDRGRILHFHDLPHHRQALWVGLDDCCCAYCWHRGVVNKHAIVFLK